MTLDAQNEFETPPNLGLAKPRLRYLIRELSRHGKVCWYFRKDEGSRTRLPDAVGTPAFMNAYRSAFNANSDVKIAKKTRRIPKKTYVYFLHAGRRMKIGFSNNPSKRADSMQTAVPERLRVALKMKGGRDLEREMHARFKDLHIRGEWFYYRGELSAFVEGREYVEIVL